MLNTQNNYEKYFSPEMRSMQNAIINAFPQYIDKKGTCRGLSELFMSYCANPTNNDPKGIYFIEYLNELIVANAFNVSPESSNSFVEIDIQNLVPKHIKEDFFDVIHYQKWQDTFEKEPRKLLNNSTKYMAELTEKLKNRPQGQQDSYSCGLNWESSENAHIAALNIRTSGDKITGFTIYDSNCGVYVYDGPEAKEQLERVVVDYQKYYAEKEPIKLYLDDSLKLTSLDRVNSVSQESAINKNVTSQNMELRNLENSYIFKKAISKNLIIPQTSYQGLYSPIGINVNLCQYMMEKANDPNSEHQEKYQHLIEDLEIQLKINDSTNIVKLDSNNEFLRTVSLDSLKKINAYRDLIVHLSDDKVLQDFENYKKESDERANAFQAATIEAEKVSNASLSILADKINEQENNKSPENIYENLQFLQDQYEDLSKNKHEKAAKKLIKLTDAMVNLYGSNPYVPHTVSVQDINKTNQQENLEAFDKNFLEFIRKQAKQTNENSFTLFLDIDMEIPGEHKNNKDVNKKVLLKITKTPDGEIDKVLMFFYNHQTKAFNVIPCNPTSITSTLQNHMHDLVEETPQLKGNRNIELRAIGLSDQEFIQANQKIIKNYLQTQKEQVKQKIIDGWKLLNLSEKEIKMYTKSLDNYDLKKLNEILDHVSQRSSVKEQEEIKIISNTINPNNIDLSSLKINFDSIKQEVSKKISLSDLKVVDQISNSIKKVGKTTEKHPTKTSTTKVKNDHTSQLPTKLKQDTKGQIPNWNKMNVKQKAKAFDEEANKNQHFNKPVNKKGKDRFS